MIVFLIDCLDFDTHKNSRMGEKVVENVCIVKGRTDQILRFLASDFRLKIS